MHLLADADDAASDSGAGITGGGAELVSSFAEIVDVGVNDDRASDDGKRTGQGDAGVGDFDVGDAVGTGFHVAQIAGVADFIDGGAVRLAVRVKMSAGGSAAVGVVTELVDVKSVKSLVETAHFAGHGDGSGGVGLTELDNAFDHLSVQNANGIQRHLRK